MKRTGPGNQLVDLLAIEADYRAGLLSLRAIAAKHGVSEAVIRKWAKKAVDGEGKAAPWARDLKPQVEARAAEILSQDRGKSAAHVRAAVRTPHAQTEIARTVRTQTEETQIVEVASRAVVQVVREHRQSILAGRQMVGLLLGQLDDAATHRAHLEDEIEHETVGDKVGKRRVAMLRAVSLPAHAGVMRDLATAMKHLVGLERQAFGLSADADPEPPTSKLEGLESDDEDFAELRAAFEKRLGRPMDVTDVEPKTS
jgi:transposase